MSPSQAKSGTLTDILLAFAFLAAVLVPMRVLMAGASLIACRMFGR